MIEISKDLCIGCEKCVRDCLCGSISLENGTAVYHLPCIQCGHCVAVCPVRAVTIPDYEMADVEDYDPDTFQIPTENMLHAIKFRRSIRQYQDRPVEQEKLEAVVQAGRYAATAVNRQNCRFIVVQDRLWALKDLVWRGVEEETIFDQLPAEYQERFRQFVRLRKAPQPVDYFFRNAPAVLYIASDNPLDAGLAAQSMEMMAVSLGLGVLYNGFVVRASALNPAVVQWLEPEDRPLVAAMLIGYPAVQYARTAPRRSASVRYL